MGHYGGALDVPTTMGNWCLLRLAGYPQVLPVVLVVGPELVTSHRHRQQGWSWQAPAGATGGIDGGARAGKLLQVVVAALSGGAHASHAPYMLPMPAT